MSQRNDLDFVADIVSGQSAAQETRTQRRNSSNRGRGRGAAAGGIHHNQQPVAPPPPLPQQQQHPLQNNADGASASGANNNPLLSTAQYNEPSSSSTARALHCFACDCWVPNKPGNWDVHTAGIRHQRQLLSIRMHGERGKLVLSAFESLPAANEPTHRLVGNAASDFGLRHTNPGPALSEPHLKLLHAIEIDVRAQVLNLWGSGQPAFNRVLENFETSFNNALLQARNTLEGRRRRTGRPVLAVSSLGEYPLDVAIIAQLLPSHPDSAKHIEIDMFPHDQSRTSQVQAWMTSITMLLTVAATLPTVSTITICEKGVREEIPPYDIGVYHQGWRHVFQLLGRIIDDPRHPVEEIKLHLFDKEPSIDAQLRDIVESGYETLRNAAREKTGKLRGQVLLGYHHRAGRCSMLQILPVTVLRRILDMALPLPGCKVELVVDIIRQ